MNSISLQTKNIGERQGRASATVWGCQLLSCVIDSIISIISRPCQISVFIFRYHVLDFLHAVFEKMISFVFTFL